MDQNLQSTGKTRYSEESLGGPGFWFSFRSGLVSLQERKLRQSMSKFRKGDLALTAATPEFKSRNLHGKNQRKLQQGKFQEGQGGGATLPVGRGEKIKKLKLSVERKIRDDHRPVIGETTNLQGCPSKETKTD